MSDKLKPISTAPRDKWILVAGDSGYATTPLRFESAKCIWVGDQWVWKDYKGDYYSDRGGEPEWWMEIPRVEEVRKTAAEWLNEPKYDGISVFGDLSVTKELTEKEFEEKLLTCRVEISKDKLKELLNKK